LEATAATSASHKFELSTLEPHERMPVDLIQFDNDVLSLFLGFKLHCTLITCPMHCQVHRRLTVAALKILVLIFESAALRHTGAWRCSKVSSWGCYEALSRALDLVLPEAKPLSYLILSYLILSCLSMSLASVSCFSYCGAVAPDALVYR
jgi:hypothetical protein